MQLQSTDSLSLVQYFARAWGKPLKKGLNSAVKKSVVSWVWWGTPFVLALGNQKQEGLCELQASQPISTGGEKKKEQGGLTERGDTCTWFCLRLQVALQIQWGKEKWKPFTGDMKSNPRKLPILAQTGILCFAEIESAYFVFQSWLVTGTSNTIINVLCSL